MVVLKLKEKNDSYAVDLSPLLPYLITQGIDLVDDTINFDKAVAWYNSFEDAEKKAGFLVAKRNNTWKTQPQTHER